MVQQEYYYGVGKRKTANARVRLYRDNGPGIVNGKLMDEVYGWPAWQQKIYEPFRVTNTSGRFRVVAKVSGGGVSSQAEALRHGITRALVAADAAYRPPLKDAGLITRDARIKERKKYGLKRARKAKQYTKR